jgi:crotonobetainyl-CoA:carnitine CoA-transferase CaiB-like acyl-CoA transferase
MSEATIPTPLSGLRVLELARVIAGPWAGQILADLGADVIKVERGPNGDDTRGYGPPFVEGTDGSHLGAAYYHACNRGKRSIVLDFENKNGQRITRALAARTDILIENFKVGTLAKFGLDYPSLAAENPGLIYCSITGFGQNGPYAHRPGYDVMIQGMGGIMELTGEPDGEPVRIGAPYVDPFTGVYSVVGILAALAERQRTGRGTHLDVALLDTQISVLVNRALEYFVSGVVPHRMGSAVSTVVPYQAFPTSDGHIIIAAGNDGLFAKLCQALGVPELATDPLYRTNSDRVINRASLIPHLSAIIVRHTRADLLTILEATQVPAGPINTLADVFENPQVIARRMRIELPSMAAKAGAIPGVRTPLMFQGHAAVSNRPSPRLGEHTEEILREIGETIP